MVSYSLQDFPMLWNTATGWFIVGIVSFALFSSLFMMFALLWVYKDAEVKSEQSPFLWVAAVFFFNVIGFIIYFLIGRNKPDTAPGSFKIPFIAMGVLWIVSIVLFVASTINFVFTVAESGVGTVGIVSGGVFTQSSTHSRDREWFVQLGSGTGFKQIVRDLTAADLSSLSVEGTVGSGNVQLELRQGPTNVIVPLSQGANMTITNIYTSGLNPGQITIRLDFQAAQNVDLLVSW
ncbi:MAG: PLD nuclease N-terminal domain-containing protein [Defluviitaleaceae bacterium]|nr:PLD nuclease N-terminal domain-containing protein [Defluviitaleaceae bacterium]